MRPVCLLMVILLSTLLYFIIESKINLLILLKKLSRERALITLHVITKKTFTLENLKNIMHSNVKMYVKR